MDANKAAAGRFRGHRLRPILLIILLLALSACAKSAPSGEEGSAKAIIYIGNPTSIVYKVAQDQGFYDGLNVEVRRLGFDEQDKTFVAGDFPITGMAPHGVARLVQEGEKLVFLNTAGGVLNFTGVAIRASDAQKYSSVRDLVGKKLGIPGFEDTWAAFEVATKELYNLNAKEDFKVVSSEPGSLLGLLASGEIDAALIFTQQVIGALAKPNDFRMIFNFTDEWEKRTTHPLLIVGLTARKAWVDENPELARKIVRGADRAVEWMKQNPERLLEGEYREWFDAAGLLTEPTQWDKFVDMVRDGKYFTDSSLYTQEWIDAQYQFIQLGRGTLVEEVPAKDDVFASPTIFQ